MRTNIANKLMVCSENKLDVYTPRAFFENLKTIHIDGEITRYMSYDNQLRKIDSVVEFVDDLFGSGSKYYCVIWDERDAVNTNEE